MKIAITGASGFVGSALRRNFPDNVVIERNDTQEQILEKLNGIDIVLNLAGAPILKRWDESYKKILISSRVETTRKLVTAINESKVKHLISTSAIGAYPDNNAYDESFDGYGDDFLAKLTQEWEDEALRCNKPTAIVRFGVILGRDGGALAQMIFPFKMGVGGIISNGKMMMSWIDIQDLMGMYNHIVENKLTGIYNATSPFPVSNLNFTKSLGSVLSRPTILPLPKFILKLLFGEGSTVLTASKEIYPKAILDAGYKFKYETIAQSLVHLLK